MQEPLLESAPPSRLFSQSTLNLLGQTVQKKLQVKNELPKVERIPMSLNQNFIEKCIEGVRYEADKIKRKELWDYENCPNLTNPQEIFQGKRGQQSKLMPLSNLITRGQIIEKNGQVIIGTTYGKMKGFSRYCFSRRKTLLNKKQASPKSPKKPEYKVGQFVNKYSFINKGQKELKFSQIYGNFLVVQDVTNSIFIYEMPTDETVPKLLDSFISTLDMDYDSTDIQGFEFRLSSSNIPTLVICYLREIKYFKMVEDFVFEATQTIKVDYHITHLLTYEEGKVLFSDSDNNVYMGDLDESLQNLKLIKSREQNTQVQQLRLKDNIITVILTNDLDSQTIVYTVDLALLEEEEKLQEILRQQEKEKEIEIEQKRKELSEEEFQLWLLKQQKPKEKEKDKKKDKIKGHGDKKKLKKSESEEQEAMPAKHKAVHDIGYCTGASFTDEGYLLLSGVTKFLILSSKRWEKIDFDVVTDFQIIRALFSSDMRHVLALGNDGILREYMWRGEGHYSNNFLREDKIEDSVSTGDGKYFAILSNNQTEVTIYSYEEGYVMEHIKDLKYAYLMNFTRNGKALIIVQGTELERNFKIVIYQLGDNQKWKCICNQLVQIEEDYIVQITAQLNNQYLYMIGKSHSHHTLHIYDFQLQKPLLKQADIMAVNVSNDEKLLAYSNKLSQICLAYIQREDNNEHQNTGEKPFKQSWIQVGRTIRSVNTIQMKDAIVHNLEFYENNQKIVVQTQRTVIGFDILTHQEQFRIQTSQSANPLRKLKILYDSYLSFQDNTSCIYQFDITYKLNPDYLNLVTKPLHTLNLKVNEKLSITHCAWSASGSHFILQQDKNQVIVARNPFLHHKLNNELVHSGPFSKIEGYYIPTFLGFKKMGVGTFASLYEYAIKQPKVDVATLSIPIYPYKLNACHYFALSGNVEGIEKCFENKINFIQDIFGKTPLDYAIESKDKLIIEAVLRGIFETKGKEKTKLLRTLRLNTLLSNTNSIVANILNNYGTSIPDVTQFEQDLSIPKLFPLKDNLYAESGLPIYSPEVAAVLHPPALAKKQGKLRPTSTYVLNNPQPKNFTADSLELLQSISDCHIDEIVRSTPITLFLNRKWNSYGFYFYLYQFLLLSGMLVSLTILDSVGESSICTLILIYGNHYFNLFEVLQLLINGKDYFLSMTNIMDLIRIALIYMYVYGGVDSIYVQRYFVLPFVLLLTWYKVISYLSVFKPTRYLIKMIHEILRDVKTFMMVLFMMMIAYAQINYVMMPAEDREVDATLRNSYVISLGELGEFEDIPLINFIVFAMFSFLIPLVLMNMIIALMGDSYARVQTNAIAADARALSEMLYELEEVVHSLFKIFKPSALKSEFYFCFQTEVNDADGEEDWEGTVGQLKRTIQEQTQLLQNNLSTQISQFIEDTTNRNTEKIVDNLLRTNQQELDVMLKVQRLVERETTEIRERVQSELVSESNRVKLQFDHTISKLEEQQEKIISQFRENKEQITIENQKVHGIVSQTKKLIESDGKEVKEQVKVNQEKMKDEIIQMRGHIMNACNLMQRKAEEDAKLTQEEIMKLSKKSVQDSNSIKTEITKISNLINAVSGSLQESGKTLEQMNQMQEKSLVKSSVTPTQPRTYYFSTNRSPVPSDKASGYLNAISPPKGASEKTSYYMLSQNIKTIKELMPILRANSDEHKMLFRIMEDIKKIQQQLLGKSKNEFEVRRGSEK